MKRVVTSLGLAFALLASALALPAAAQNNSARNAVTSPSVEIATVAAIARGGYVEPTTGKWVVFRPYYPVKVRALCPAGTVGALRYTPVFAMNLGGFNFNCTGKRQMLTFQAAAMNGVNELGLHRQRPTVTLFSYNGSPTDGGTLSGPLDTDSENIWVYTARAAQ